MFLIDGFKYGFHLFSVGQSRSYESPNLLSAQQQPQVVDQKLAKELEAHRLAGPFDTPPFPVFRVSPLGIVPKKTPGEFRLIHHLSYPMGKSVNDGISHEHSSVQYANIDHAIKKIKQSGIGSYLAKTDIKSAFRILPINPQDYHLLGIKWSGQYHYDKCMPMGCSRAYCSLRNEMKRNEMEICSLRNGNLLSRCVYSDIVNRKFPPKKPFRPESSDCAECVTFSLPRIKFKLSSGVFE